MSHRIEPCVFSIVVNKNKIIFRAINTNFMRCFVWSKKWGDSCGGGGKNGMEDEFVLANQWEFAALETTEFVVSIAGLFFAPVKKSMKS